MGEKKTFPKEFPVRALPGKIQCSNPLCFKPEAYVERVLG
jgi:hypothetical protein